MDYDGMYEDPEFIKIKTELAKFAENKLSDTSSRFNIADFHECKVNWLHGVDNRPGDYQLIIDDMQIISDASKDEKRYILCHPKDDLENTSKKMQSQIENHSEYFVFKVAIKKCFLIRDYFKVC